MKFWYIILAYIFIHDIAWYFTSDKLNCTEANLNKVQFSSNPPFYNLLNNIVDGVVSLVHDYFFTFRFCWSTILNAFVKMISEYVHLLGYVTLCLTSYPGVFFATVCVGICMWCISRIIK